MTMQYTLTFEEGIIVPRFVTIDKKFYEITKYVKHPVATKNYLVAYSSIFKITNEMNVDYYDYYEYIEQSDDLDILKFTYKTYIKLLELLPETMFVNLIEENDASKIIFRLWNNLSYRIYHINLIDNKLYWSDCENEEAIIDIDRILNLNDLYLNDLLHSSYLLKTTLINYNPKLADIKNLIVNISQFKGATILNNIYTVDVRDCIVLYYEPMTVYIGFEIDEDNDIWTIYKCYPDTLYSLSVKGKIDINTIKPVELKEYIEDEKTFDDYTKMLIYINKVYPNLFS